MSGWHGGKGSDPRPLSVSAEEFGKRFDAIDWNARERAKGSTDGLKPTDSTDALKALRDLADNAQELGLDY